MTHNMTSANYARWLAALFAFCLFLFFFRLGSAPIFDLDEGLYAACCKVMAQSGNWITPLLNSRMPGHPHQLTTPFFEKPILVYWLGAAFIKALGATALAVRLPVALIALITTFVVVWAGTRWFGRRAGLLAGMVYATLPITLIDARQLTTDGPLVLIFTCQMLAFYAALRAWQRGQKPAGRKWAIFYWALTALAVLAKGAVGLLLPPIVFVVYALLQTIVLRVQMRGGIRMQGRLAVQPLQALRPAVQALWLPAGLLLCFVIAAPWHYLVWKAGGRDELGYTWFQQYIIRQHIGRFKGLDKVHDAPFFTYLLYFLAGFFPWSGFAPAALRTRTSADDPARPAERYLQVWFWTIVGGFSFAAAKLPTYIAPAYPAAALLVGRWLDQVCSAVPNAQTLRSLRNGARTAFGVSVVLMAAALIGPLAVPRSAPIAPEIKQAALLTAVCAAAGTWAALRWLPSPVQGRRTKGIAALAATAGALVLAGCTLGYHAAAAQVLGPYQQIAHDAAPDAQAGIPVVYYHIIPRRPSMLFYAGYSPFERKQAALFHWLYREVAPQGGPIDLAASTRVVRRDLMPRLLKLHLQAQPLKKCKGWELLRIVLPARIGMVQ